MTSAPKLYKKGTCFLPVLLSLELKVLFIKSILLSTLLLPSVVSASPLEPVGKPIRLPFPNDQSILGVGGLGYDSQHDLFSASSDDIALVSNEKGTSNYDVSVPHFYHVKLDFEDASVQFILDKPIVARPDAGLKLEGLAVVPEDRFSSLIDLIDKDMWLASESHSHLAKTSKFLSKDFGSPDLSSFDRETFSSSRLVHVNGATSDVLEEVTLPPFASWDLECDRESTNCERFQLPKGGPGHCILMETLVVSGCLFTICMDTISRNKESASTLKRLHEGKGRLGKNNCRNFIRKKCNKP